MSDRVSRLAELRRKRDSRVSKGSGGAISSASVVDNTHVGAKDGNDLDNGAADIVKDTEMESTIDSKAGFEAKDIDNPNTVEAVETVIAQDTNELPRKSNETGPQNITYNSDLKKDIFPLLLKAQEGTERALNEIIWKAYLQNQAD